MIMLDTLNNIIESKLYIANLKYCLVNQDKVPFRVDDEPARTNNFDDFVDFDMLLQNTNLSSYSGVGISIQASNICAIDVDKCFSTAFDLSTADLRALDIISRFKDVTYIEFSFSGKGLRVLFRANLISDYSDKFYIKCKANGVEYYQPSHSYRYVTVTGRTIRNNEIVKNEHVESVLFSFLNEYMRKPIKSEYEVVTPVEETRSFKTLMAITKGHYLTNMIFQNLWFNPAPGSGKDESERDYHLIAYLYENVTQDKDLLKQIFEQSEFFKTKDSKHVYKWVNQDFRYFNHLYGIMRRTK